MSSAKLNHKTSCISFELYKILHMGGIICQSEWNLIIGTRNQIFSSVLRTVPGMRYQGLQTEAIDPFDGMMLLCWLLALNAESGMNPYNRCWICDTRATRSHPILLRHCPMSSLTLDWPTWLLLLHHQAERKNQKGPWSLVQIVPAHLAKCRICQHITSARMCTRVAMFRGLAIDEWYRADVWVEKHSHSAQKYSLVC